MSTEKFIPALSYDWLTPFYDPVVRWIMREKIFKAALVEQAQIRTDHQVLDLACGTGTLTILLKKAVPESEVVGLDGDPKILKIARGKALEENLEIRFDEGMSFELPYAAESFDRVVSSLFFHHLTWENKMRTLLEVKRVLKPWGELHVADWGYPSGPAMKCASLLIQLLDGFETTADNFNGHLPLFIRKSGFERVEETFGYNTLFGTVRSHWARKP